MRFIITTALAMALCACGGDQSLTFAETLVIGMEGVFTAPEGATGNAEPRNLTVTLENVQVVGATAGTVDLYTDEPAEFIIASRSQVIFEADMADYLNDTISEVRVTFSATATATGKYEAELPVTLSTTEIVHTGEIVVTAAQTNRVNVLVQWLNTITRDETVDPPTETITSPSFTTELAD